MSGKQTKKPEDHETHYLPSSATWSKKKKKKVSDTTIFVQDLTFYKPLFC